MSSLTAAALKAAIASRLYPTVTTWNRLEGRPRARTFDRALRAEVRDALFMVTRQWQMGEYIGDDAGSPLGAQLHAEVSTLYRYEAAGVAEPYDPSVPLETKVERQEIALTRAGTKIHYDLRVEAGRHLGKLLAAAGLTSYAAEYRRLYPFELPADDRSAAATAVYAHTEARQLASALAGRAIDGGELYLYLRADAARHASDGVSLVDPGDGAALDAIGAKLVAWFDALYDQPTSAGAWSPSRLEHSFSCAAPLEGTDEVLVADEYPGGHLDWSSFDLAAATRTQESGPDAAGFRATITRSFLPAPLTFDGMPHARWWKLEDSKVSLPEVTPATTDLAKLLLIELGLVYANDWFLLPLTVPSGTLVCVRGMTVTNSFGERFFVDAAGRGPEDAWQGWRMYNLSSRGSQEADTGLFVAPAVPKIQNGAPLDEVFFVRDEMANMVWAVESRIPLVTGGSRAGHEAGREVTAYHRRLIGDAPETEPLAAPIHYTAMTSVPECWIPFIPVHVEGSTREIQLQRGRLLRLLEGDSLPPAKIDPMTLSVRRGLDELEKQPYFVHEEEVPRAGTRLTRAFQRTRWRDGHTYVWLAMARETGRGEATSRLAFDQITTARSR